ncbi:hypothetical protein EPN44_05860 [bacterium]|nr:MAG: hypothetical protein EPN44_05860 [bacterium]
MAHDIGYRTSPFGYPLQRGQGWSKDSTRELNAARIIAMPTESSAIGPEIIVELMRLKPFVDSLLKGC